MTIKKLGPTAWLCLAISGSLTHHARAASWTSFAIDTLTSTYFRTTALAHLPDGRFVYGVSGQLFVQKDFIPGAITDGAVWKGVSTSAILPTVIDPSFIAVRDAFNAIVGQGGYLPPSNVYTFDPSPVAPALVSAPLVSSPNEPPQNYTGVYWKSPTSLLEGWLVSGTNWLVAGSNPPAYVHNVVFISLDGTKTGPVTATISTYSGGIAVDAAGNLYAATYEIDENWEPTADANRILKFSGAHVEAAIQAVIAGSPAPIPVSSSAFVFRFDSTSNIAVDSLGRVWATGYAVNRLQVFDPATQTMSRIVPQHGPFPTGTDVLYTLGHFTRSAVGNVSFLAQDENGNAGTNVYAGYAADSSIVIPRMDQWRAQHFGVHNLTLAKQENVWGPEGDPDRDGAANLIEYAGGTSPNIPDASSITCGVSGGALQLSFIRDPLNTDLIYAVEVSSTLAAGGWVEIARSTAGAPTVNLGPGSVSEIAEGARFRVTVTDSVSTVPKFARLRAILLPP
jgi:hypothetical protein